MGGGGYEVYPQLVQTLNKKYCKNARQYTQNTAKNGTKNKYKTSPPITQVMLWLLVFCIFAAFSLCPLAGLATRYNLTAGGPKADTFYINAPVFIAGDSARSETTGSANTSTGVVNTGIKPLFKIDGTVDADVLADLLNMVNDSEVMKNPIGTGGVKYYSAKNFGQYANLTGAQKGNAQILVKLFETTDFEEAENANNVNEASAQYWQAVYRSVNGENDVLTLYMVRPYVTTSFNPSSQDGEGYIREGNYSHSYLRDKTVLPLYETLKSIYSALDKYVVAPYQLSSSGASDMSKTTIENPVFLNLGGWQSSAYQTSYNKEGVLYSTNSGIGSSGSMNGSTNFGVENGMDGLSGAHSRWSGTVESVYNDKLWVPSGYEVLHTGYGSSNAVAEDGTTGRKVENGKYYDEGNDIVWLSSSPSASATPSNSNSFANRTGLWELSAYDRASYYMTWLRSGLSPSDSNGYSNHSRGIYDDGDSGYPDVSSNYGVRVALHLSLGALASPMEETALNISATNNAANSLLVLTVMEGNTRIAEYSCVSGTFNANVTLDWNKTYKIIATRPFGCSLEVELDEVLLSPTAFAYYEIYTAENASMNISFMLTGDNSWNNCIVI